MSEKEIASINWQKVNGLLPVIVQDYQTSEVLMLGYMNEEALRQSLAQKKVVFFSRTKQRRGSKARKAGIFCTSLKWGLIAIKTHF